MTAPRAVRVVAALMCDPEDAGRFLIQQRGPHGARALLWEFPGGKVEPGEGDEAALARECEEELGVRVAVGRRLWGTEHAYPDLTVTLVLYSATLEGGEPKPLGAHALRYATPGEMQGLPFCEADLPLLEALARGAL